MKYFLIALLLLLPVGVVAKEEVKTYLLTEEQMETLSSIVQERTVLLREIKDLKKELTREKNKTCI